MGGLRSFSLQVETNKIAQSRERKEKNLILLLLFLLMCYSLRRLFLSEFAIICYYIKGISHTTCSFRGDEGLSKYPFKIIYGIRSNTMGEFA